MSSGGWSCPHNAEGRCVIMNLSECIPGKKGCVLSKNGEFISEIPEHLKGEGKKKRGEEPLNSLAKKSSKK